MLSGRHGASALLAALPRPLVSAWRDMLDGWQPRRIRRGQTEADVWRLRRDGAPPRYMKLAQGDEATTLRLEAAKLGWLNARQAPVPPLIDAFDDGETVAIMTEALPGWPASDSPLPAADLAEHLGRGLSRLHATPLDGWPFEDADGVRLEKARARLRSGKMRRANFAEMHRHFTPATLFGSLADKPSSARALTHGDADLANALVTPEGSVGFVDCGDAGPADPYLDLFEMADSVAARLGDTHVPAFFAAYGIPAPDPRRLAYYARLDEFF